MKEGDLEAEQAFRIVLDRLVEETREAHVVREKNGDLHGQIRDLEKRLAGSDQAREIVVRSLTKREAGDRKLGVLHTEATKACIALDLIVGDPPTFDTDALKKLVESLRTAITEAEDYCDPIPF